jgi:aspartyl-tRNA(Asn)/glutamyl-tRNA(Gln) amidotransferase subunit A
LTEGVQGGPLPTTIAGLHRTFISGTLTPTGATASYLRRIDERNPSLNCFITKLTVSAGTSAAEAERRFASGSPLGPLDGVPIAVKDVIYISGVKCTAGSKILANNVATYDSPVVRRLKDAGAVLVGTTNLHEFTAGVTSNNPHFGPVRNPWNPDRIAGGSSGGSAAAVASGMVPAALGTDTAGSVRIPAALCGVLGLKPTYGRVSRLGVIPLAPSFDTVGVLTSSAWDAAAMLQTIAGHDEGDPTTVETPVPDYLSDLDGPFQPQRVGIPENAFQGRVDPAIQGSFDSFVGRLKEIGCGVETSVLDGWDEASENWVPIRRAEATAFHLKWLDSVPELYGEDVRALMEKGKDIKAVDYVNAVNSRPSLMQRFATSMASLDLIAVPTTCATAPKVGETVIKVGGKEIETYIALNSLTLPFNMVGFPAISVPAGHAQGLPVGVQLVAKPFEESRLLRTVHAYEERFGPFPRPVGA